MRCWCAPWSSASHSFGVALAYHPFEGELKKGFDDAVQELISQRRGDKLPCAGRFKPASGYRGFGSSDQLVESCGRRLRKGAKRHARFES